MLCSSYFNIQYDLSRLWLLTEEECCLQVQRGQYNVKASLIYRGTCSNAYILINNQYFWQYFTGTYVKGVLWWPMQKFPGVCLGQLGGVSGIHMIRDYFGLGEGIVLKLCRMKGNIWSY